MTGPSAGDSPFAANDNFMEAELEDPRYAESDGGFGATVSLNPKRKGKKK